MKFRYNSMSDAGRSLAARAKRHFHKQYPGVRVGINAMEGWIEVEGKKAVNMSSASSRPMSLEDVVDQMKQAYLGHPVQENAMKITKRQLRQIIKEEKQKLQEYSYNTAVAPRSHFNEREIVADLLAVMDNWRDKKVSEGQFILALEEALRVAIESQR